MKELYCLRCGGNRLKNAGGGNLQCQYCGAVYADDSLTKQADAICELFGEALADQRAKDIGTARNNLYEALHSEYLSYREIFESCKKIKGYLSNDKQASIFAILNEGRPKEVNKLLNELDVSGEVKYYVKDILDFMLKSLSSQTLLSVKNFADRVLSGEEKTKYINAIEEEGEKFEAGLYNPQIPRKAFIAYSSKDMEQVNDIVDRLESAGISCFVALRNMRHGRGSVENYGNILRAAMHNCKSFVFISSRNSRRLDCDAISKEIPYIRDNEPQVKRIEYIIDDYGN